MIWFRKTCATSGAHNAATVQSHSFFPARPTRWAHKLATKLFELAARFAKYQPVIHHKRPRAARPAAKITIANDFWLGSVCCLVAVHAEHGIAIFLNDATVPASATTLFTESRFSPDAFSSRDTHLLVHPLPARRHRTISYRPHLLQRQVNHIHKRTRRDHRKNPIRHRRHETRSATKRRMPHRELSKVNSRYPTKIQLSRAHVKSFSEKNRQDTPFVLKNSGRGRHPARIQRHRRL